MSLSVRFQPLLDGQKGLLFFFLYILTRDRINLVIYLGQETEYKKRDGKRVCRYVYMPGIAILWGGSVFYKVVLLFLLLKYTVVSSLSLFKTLDCLVCQ